LREELINIDKVAHCEPAGWRQYAWVIKTRVRTYPVNP